MERRTGAPGLSRPAATITRVCVPKVMITIQRLASLDATIVTLLEERVSVALAFGRGPLRQMAGPLVYRSVEFVEA